MDRESVFIDPVYLHSERGIGRVCKDMVKHSELIINTFDFISPTLCNVILKWPFLYVFWEQVILPCLLYLSDCKVFIASSGTCPIFVSRKIKIILLIHDVLYLEENLNIEEKASLRQKLGKIYRRNLLNAAVNRANLIITISNFTKNRLINLTKTKKVDKVLYNFVNHAKPAPGSERKNQILFFTTQSYTKNPRLVLSAIPHLDAMFSDIQLIIVGMKKPKEYQSAFRHVVFYDKVSESCLNKLFLESKIAIIPSFYEGFGLPVLEATCSGCIPIVSNIEVFNEIAPNIVKFDPTSVNSLIDAITSVLDNFDEHEFNRMELARYWRAQNSLYQKKLKEILEKTYDR